MRNYTVRQVSIALVISTLGAVSALAAGTDTPSAPVTSPPPASAPPAASTKAAPATDATKPATKPADKKSFLEDPAFLKGYRAAYATVYERNDYAAAIPQLEALGQDDRADVANLIGYSYRKLGNYQLASAWYERALKVDPNHVRTWQYYGLWQIEQGNREQAVYHLGKIEKICGKDCAEYKSLAAALTTGQTTY